VKLVVVESPAKAKTIGRYLGKEYVVRATMGHVKDLPKSRLAVDTEKNYKVEYEVILGKKKVLSELKRLLPRNEKDVYLALDPDREGEAIAAHVAEELKLKHPKRIVFHEVTQSALQEAIDHPREVNEDLVDAQKARRVLDRLVGYKLSGLLWKKIWYGLSAGRVQSVATRLIVERERERLAFVPKEFWEVRATLEGEEKNKVVAGLEKKNDKNIVPASKKEVDEILKELDGAQWTVSAVDTQEKTRSPLPPFTTATLQQSANSFLGYSASTTMKTAQQLYQGVKISGQGQIGLITYMRTDSTALASQAVDAMRKEIGRMFGEEYLPEKAVFYKTRSRLAQEAHEAIRPTDVSIHPDQVKDSLSDQQYKLYKLIWNRAVACQMMPMRYSESVVGVDALCKSGTGYLFTLTGREIVFDGFAKVLGTWLIREEGMQEIGTLTKDDVMKCLGIETEQRFTKPKSRYTEATLIKALERRGIGRPSTYATIISTIQGRSYVAKDGRYLFPTDVGMVVNDFLVAHFPLVVDYDFTSEVEQDLDDIAQGEKKWVPVIDDVYAPFEKILKEKEKSVKKEDIVILGTSDVKCPLCKGKMVERLGREGRFLSCAKFPECKGMLGIDGKSLEQIVDLKKYEKAEACEKCGGKMVLKRGKYGQFWACENYPTCKETGPLLLKEKCPTCGSPLVERKGKWGKMFIGCSGYPACTYIQKNKPEIKK
jgi:DNA topoisomerase I